MQKMMNKILLIFIVFAVSAASFEGFFVKWTFRDSDFQAEKYSFQAIYDGTAHRPFVHRQLLISTAKIISENLPNDAKTAIINKIKADNFLADNFKQVDLQDRFMLEYYIVYFISFICLFASIFIWRRICIDLTGNSIAGTLVPLIFTIIFPYLETFGGYFYDFSELLFFSLATFFAYRGHFIALILLTPLAEYNKESFFFFVMTLFPLLCKTQSFKTTIIALGMSVLLAGLTYLSTISRFAENPGGMVESHIMGNVIAIVMLAYFIGVYFLCRKIHHSHKILSYIACPILLSVPFILRGSNYPLPFSVFDTFGHTYSIISGERAFLLHIAIIFWIVKSAWKFLDESLKNHAKLAFIINTPLIILFGAVFELRNWSLLYPSFILLISL